MRVISYNKQNKLQKEMMRLYSIFKPNWNQINRAKEAGYDPYNIGATKVEKTGVGLIIFCTVCPATCNLVSIPIIYKVCLGKDFNILNKIRRLKKWMK